MLIPNPWGQLLFICYPMEICACTIPRILPFGAQILALKPGKLEASTLRFQPQESLAFITAMGWYKSPLLELDGILCLSITFLDLTVVSCKK